MSDKRDFKHQVALALLQNIKDWAPILTLEELGTILDEESPNSSTATVQEIITFHQRGFAVILDQFTQSITDQLY